MRSMRVVKRAQKKEREREREKKRRRESREREREHKKRCESENCGRASAWRRRKRKRREENRGFPSLSFLVFPLFFVASFFLTNTKHTNALRKERKKEREAHINHGRILGRAQTQRHLARLVDRAHSRVHVYFRRVSKGGLIREEKRRERKKK